MILSFLLLKCDLFFSFLHYLLSDNLQPRDHCGLWRLLVATIGITGVVVVARPPGIFPPEVSLTLEIVFGLCQFLFLLRCGSMPWPSTTPASIQWRALHQSRTSLGFSGLLPSRFLRQPSTSSPDRWNGVVKVSLNTDLPSQAKHVHYSVFVFWFGVSGLVVSTSGLCWANVMHNPFEVEIWDQN